MRYLQCRGRRTRILGLHYFPMRSDAIHSLIYSTIGGQDQEDTLWSAEQRRAKRFPSIEASSVPFQSESRVRGSSARDHFVEQIIDDHRAHLKLLLYSNVVVWRAHSRTKPPRPLSRH